MRLREGAWPPGSLLNIGELADEFRTSTTPVREALARLAGEGLLVEARGRGFASPRFDVEELVALYDLHEAEVVLAVATSSVRLRGTYMPPRGLAAALTGVAESGLVDIAAKVFETIVHASANAPLARAHASTSERLAPARRAEAALIPDAGEELLRLARSYDAHDAEELRHLLQRYHQQRRSLSAAVHGEMENRWSLLPSDTI